MTIKFPHALSARLELSNLLFHHPTSSCLPVFEVPQSSPFWVIICWDLSASLRQTVIMASDEHAPMKFFLTAASYVRFGATTIYLDLSHGKTSTGAESTLGNLLIERNLVDERTILYSSTEPLRDQKLIHLIIISPLSRLSPCPRAWMALTILPPQSTFGLKIFQWLI